MMAIMCEEAVEEDEVPLVRQKWRTPETLDLVGAQQRVDESSLGPGDEDQFLLPSAAILGEDTQAASVVSCVLDVELAVDDDDLRGLEDAWVFQHGPQAKLIFLRRGEHKITLF